MAEDLGKKLLGEVEEVGLDEVRPSIVYLSTTTFIAPQATDALVDITYTSPSG